LGERKKPPIAPERRRAEQGVGRKRGAGDKRYRRRTLRRKKFILEREQSLMPGHERKKKLGRLSCGRGDEGARKNGKMRAGKTKDLH